jgi:hypothetical protein
MCSQAHFAEETVLVATGFPFHHLQRNLMLQVIYQSALRLAITPQLVSAQIRIRGRDHDSYKLIPLTSTERAIPEPPPYWSPASTIYMVPVDPADLYRIFDGGIAEEGLAYLRTMPNSLWFWRALELVLNYRNRGDRRVISKFELEYAVYAYGKEIERRYQIEGLPEEMPLSTVCELFLSGYLLLKEEPPNGSAIVVNPLFARDFSLH